MWPPVWSLLDGNYTTKVLHCEARSVIFSPKYAERNTLDLRAGALKTPRVSPLASIDIEIAWENPLSSRHLGRGIFCGLSHAISISMAQREALGRSWRFQSPGQRISASRKMRDHIYQLRY
jgi:hypothetical protein